MKKQLIFLFVLTPILVFSQETDKTSNEVNQLFSKLEDFILQEKKSLKDSIKQTEQLYKSRKLSEEEFKNKKESLSTITTQRIENKVRSTLNNIDKEVKSLVKLSLESNSEQKNDSITPKQYAITLKTKQKKNNDSDEKKVKSTYNRAIFGIGFNNLIDNHKISTLSKSPYNVKGSTYINLGWGFRTAFNKNNPTVGIDYGVNLIWKELKLFNNQYHIVEDDKIIITKHQKSLKKSKLRTTLLTIPIFLDFDFGYKNKTADNSLKKLKFGLGGYAGIKLNSKQILKFNKPRNSKKQILKQNYNINNLNYGIGAYIGLLNYALQLNYDLSPLFNDTKKSNISLGVRVDF